MNVFTKRITVSILAEVRPTFQNAPGENESTPSLFSQTMLLITSERTSFLRRDFLVRNDFLLRKELLSVLRHLFSVESIVFCGRNCFLWRELFSVEGVVFWRRSCFLWNKLLFGKGLAFRGSVPPFQVNYSITRRFPRISQTFTCFLLFSCVCCIVII